MHIIIRRSSSSSRRIRNCEKDCSSSLLLFVSSNTTIFFYFSFVYKQLSRKGSCTYKFNKTNSIPCSTSHAISSVHLSPRVAKHLGQPRQINRATLLAGGPPESHFACRPCTDFANYCPGLEHWLSNDEQIARETLSLIPERRSARESRQIPREITVLSFSRLHPLKSFSCTRKFQ